MNLPETVEAVLGDETAVGRVPLGGEDELVATPTRTLVYRAEGLLSDESVDEFPHDAERIAVAEGRRKGKLTLDYGLDGERTFTVPRKRVDDVLLHVVRGVFDAAGITDEDEDVERVFRFSELTLVVTSARVVRHIGSAVWDEDFEEYRYDDVTDLAFEQGSVATTVVVTLGDRQERFKTPNDRARAVRESIESALFAHRDIGSVEELRTESAGPTEAGDGDAPAARDGETRGEALSFGDGPDPLSANPAELAEEPSNATRPRAEPSNAAGDPVGSTKTPAGPDGEDSDPEEGGQIDGFDFGDSGVESAEATEGDVAAELAALREAVETFDARLRRQEALIEQLIEELRRGR